MMPRNEPAMLPLLLLLLLPALLLAAAPQPDKEIKLRMPGVSPKKEDTYLCTAIPIADTRYIRKFTPQHKSHHAHHMIVAGCSKPGSTKKVWNCGEMQSNTQVSQGDGLEVAPQCAGSTRMLYAYAMDAPALTLPPDVTFGVGPRFNLPYLVVQVHYKKTEAFVKDPSLKDHSGVDMEYQLQPSPRLAGIHLSVTDGVVPAHSESMMETACSYDGKAELHPFAFRTHTHAHGRVVSGFRVRDGMWTLIGSANPQKPQMFYPVNNTLTIRPGDTIAARCVMENTGNKDVVIGATQKDEMCNFYMMYWMRSRDVGRDGSQICYTAFNRGAASLWNRAPDFVSLISSTIPGTERIFGQAYREIASEIDHMRREMLDDEASMALPDDLEDF